MATARVVWLLTTASLLVAGPAAASTVRVEGKIVFEAAPGEQNDVTVTAVVAAGGGAEVTLRDAGATLTAGRGCVAAPSGEVVCRMELFTDLEFVRASLADGDDRFSAAGVCTGAAYEYCRFAVRGGTGDDTIVGGEAADDLAGEAGNDSLDARAGVEPYGFVPSGDIVDGGPGADRVAGGRGRDLLIGRAGADVFVGGPGWDTVSYANARVAVHVDLDGLADDGPKGERDLVAGDIEELLGGRGSDRLVGNRRANALDGGAGNDVLLGRGGADTLIGHLGSDRLRGGPGRDRLSATWADPQGHAIPNETGGRGRDLLFGEAGNDFLDGWDGTSDRLSGGSGRDEAVADRGLDRVLAVERVRHADLPEQAGRGT